MYSSAQLVDKPAWIDDYYTLDEVASFLGISPRTLTNRIHLGVDHPPVVPGYGKAKRFPKDEFKKWTKSRVKYQAF